MEGDSMKRILAVLGILTIVATVAQAAWTKPTQAQIDEAAKNPSLLPGLLQGSSDADAGALIAAVLQSAATVTPPAGQTTASLVNQIVTLGTQGRSQQGVMVIAKAVGSALGQLAVALPAIAAIGGTVQTAFAGLSNASSTGIAAAYTANYNQGVRGAASGKPADNLLLPPVSGNYGGQG